MKYESSILKRLIDTYGVVGNPRYISEIIKEFIVQGKERFPNLFTYQADWLAHIDEFGLNPSYSVSYTGQSIYAPNTLEKPVKSAILKGQTLVNRVSSYGFGGNSLLYEARFFDNPFQKGETITVFVVNPNVTTIKVGSYSEETGNWLTDITYDVSINKKINYIVPNDTIVKYVGVVVNNENDSSGFENSIVVVNGDQSHLNINTYFDGMQSVKMPVLTTTGKNLFDGELQQGYWSTSSGLHLDYQGSVCSVNPIKVQEDTYLTISQYGEVTYSGTMLFLCYDANSNLLGYIDNGGRVYKNTSYVHFRIYDASGTMQVVNPNIKIQVESSSIPSSYEPYKTNILRTPEDLALRGIGDVQDTLDCLTGERVERIGEIVLDGSEGWRLSDNLSEVRKCYVADLTNVKLAESNSVTTINNRMSSITYNLAIKDKQLGIFARTSTNGLGIVIDIEYLIDFKTYLQQNPITVQYVLATESIKTVDLNILDQNGQNIKQLMSFNGGTHFITGSAEGSPLPVVSVTVETDLEETLKVCSLDGNTM